MSKLHRGVILLPAQQLKQKEMHGELGAWGRPAERGSRVFSMEQNQRKLPFWSSNTKITGKVATRESQARPVGSAQRPASQRPSRKSTTIRPTVQTRQTEAQRVTVTYLPDLVSGRDRPSLREPIPHDTVQAREAKFAAAASNAMGTGTPAAPNEVSGQQETHQSSETGLGLFLVVFFFFKDKNFNCKISH